MLHPDPPLSDEDAAVFGDAVQFMTPSGRYLGERGRLAGRVLGLSMSESTDCERFGVTHRSLDDVYLELSRGMLLLGATLAYGGYLQLDGYTLALFDAVKSYHANENAPRLERVINYLGWPVKGNAKVEAKYKFDASFRRVPRPGDADLAKWPKEGMDSPKSVPELAAWSRGMTALRHIMTGECHARILLGGKVGPKANASADAPWFASRMPGVLEEALFSVEARQPLYLVGGWGGAARLVGDLLRGHVPEAATWEFQSRSPLMAELHRDWIRPGGEVLYARTVKVFHDAGPAGCNNGLSAADNDELFQCRHAPRIIELIVTGLSRLQTPPPPSAPA